MTTRITGTERDPQTSAVIAAAIEVHRTLGRGFFEYVYRTPLEMELLERGIPYKREVSYPVVYKGKPTGIAFRVDLVCYGEVGAAGCAQVRTGATGARRCDPVPQRLLTGVDGVAARSRVESADPKTRACENAERSRDRAPDRERVRGWVRRGRRVSRDRSAPRPTEPG